jgi:hypothetical protein
MPWEPHYERRMKGCQPSGCSSRGPSPRRGRVSRILAGRNLGTRAWRPHDSVWAQHLVAASATQASCRRRSRCLPGRRTRSAASLVCPQGSESALPLPEPRLRLPDRRAMLAPLLLLHPRGTLGLGARQPRRAARLRRKARARRVEHGPASRSGRRENRRHSSLCPLRPGTERPWRQRSASCVGSPAHPRDQRPSTGPRPARPRAPAHRHQRLAAGPRHQRAPLPGAHHLVAHRRDDPAAGAAPRLGGVAGPRRLGVQLRRRTDHGLCPSPAPSSTTALRLIGRTFT